MFEIRASAPSTESLSGEPALDWGTVFELFGWSALFGLLLIGFVVYSLNT